MASFSLRNATKPCSDCLITFMLAGLEYEDGSYANANTGMWLHHVVLLNLAQKDTVCPSHPERIFASGNERTPINICANGTQKAGYHLTSSASLLIAPELMNTSPHPRSVYITLTYEYIPSPSPLSFSPIKLIWLDIGGCGSSEYSLPPDSEPAFSITSPAWSASISGEITFGAAHPHDGGLDVKVLRNDEWACVSRATYGESEGYREEGEGEGGREHEHVSGMSVCWGLGRMERGEEWGVVVRYDLDAREPMRGMHGDLEPVMGIALLYVALDADEESEDLLE
ncbi:hypothetical protein EG329_000738 [Mollisiaceae sp. DMI_Dod_QoI]|nr:hypothetical protein EG329_000738 [Helotiales sp. DMI_Dod_QoI]